MNAALVLRALAAVCLAGVVLGIPERSPFVAPRDVLVLDESPSVRRSLPGFVEEAAKLWESFHGGGRPVVAVGRRTAAAGTAETAAGFADIPSALRIAASLAPRHVETNVLLATDGASSIEGLEATRRLLRDRDVRVWALIPPQPARLARVVEIVLPERVFLWEPFTVSGRIMASHPGPLEVELIRNGESTAKTTVTVGDDGSAIADFTQEADRVGRLGLAIGIAGSALPPAAGEVSVAQSPRVEWLSEDVVTASPLVGLLRSAGVEVGLHRPGDLTVPAADLAKADVLVLDDIPLAAMTDALTTELARRVGTRGEGLVVFGGRKGLGAGEYAGTKIEALLPVVAGFRSPPPPPSVAMVLVLDSSFSMAYRGRGETSAHGTDPRKIDVAKESAKEVVRIVRSGDRLGIIGNSTDIFWIAPLGEVVNPDAVIRRIDQIKPVGDGLYFYSVLHEAREALRREQSGVRHVLVLCDAEDIDQYEVVGRGHSFDLLREMAQEGITVSVLAIGNPTDKDVPFLRTAALLGRGDFYLIPRIVALPRYFVSEYRRISSARHFVEEQIRAVASDPSVLSLLSPGGVFPPLEGMALLTPREGSQTLLQSDFGAPLLVGGSYGRGRTAVFAGDDGYRWAARWVGTDALRRFWLQLIFGVAPPEERARGFASFLAADPATKSLLFHYAGSDGALPAWDTLWMLPEGETDAPLRLDRIGLRAYRGALPPGESNFRRVRIAEDRQGQRPLLTTGYSVPPTGEDLPRAPQLDVVGRLVKETGGAWVNHPEQMLPLQPAANRLPVPATVLFIAVGVSFLLAEVLVRTFREG